jgi:hypothetical protein
LAALSMMSNWIGQLSRCVKFPAESCFLLSHVSR